MAGMFFMFVMMVVVANLAGGYSKSLTNNLKTKD